MVGGQPISMPYAQAPAQAYIPPRLDTPRTAAPKLLARGQMDNVPPAVRIPTPEEVGLASSKITTAGESMDWSMVERRMKAVGATSYKFEKTASGHRCTLELPTGPIVGHGETKEAAVRTVLAQLPH